MKRNHHPQIPDFSPKRKPTAATPDAMHPAAEHGKEPSPARSHVVTRNAKPKATSVKSGRRGQ